GAWLIRISIQDSRWEAAHRGGRDADAWTFGRDENALQQEAAMRLMSRVGNWLDQRLQLGAPIRETMEHSIPRDTASWFYVFGSAAMTVFALQLVTGILLALIYVPSGGEAWSSLQVLNHQVALGWFIRALHGWGSNFVFVYR